MQIGPRDNENWGVRIFELLESRSVIRIPTAGPLRHQARRAVMAGLAIRPLPGIVMSTRVEGDPRAWIYANWLWRPTSVITGRAALSLQMRPRLNIQTVDALLPYRYADRGLFRFHYSSLPGELITDLETGLAAVPAAAALFLGSRDDWAPICDALRTGAVTAEEIREARDLLPRRADARLMNRTVRYIGESPWSVPELELHELFRLVGITGWKGNLPVRLNVNEGGRTSLKERSPDAAFEAEKLAVEVNSEQYHNSADAFAKDTLRARWFASAGWRQFPVTPAQLRSNPNDFLADLCSRLHRAHRPASLSRVRYQPGAPFWRILP
ncbi:hypothetical protein JS278_02708 [Acidipropionibacterium virtanenii]|uniref:DUF559 domain-containing protein n=1 Tax=Acidipropionibacterium virtanenii TaxID=2057246 RepID=A0A344UX45_9ACTN|nr:hypothetical protein JS278_02708 [Acidipropionibacterium virtanenii]